MDKSEFIRRVEEVATRDFIVRFCDISEEELERLIELDDWLMLVSDVYDQMPKEELDKYIEELNV